MAEGEEGFAPLDGSRWGWRDTDKVNAYSHGTCPQLIPSIMANGIRRSLNGAGAYSLVDVFGCPVAGVYTTDRLGTACRYPQTRAAKGPHNTSGLYGSDVVAEDGALPMRCVIRRIGNEVEGDVHGPS